MRTRRNRKQSRQVGKGVRGTFGFGRSSQNWCVETDLITDLTAFITTLLKDELDKNRHLFASNMSDAEYVDRLTRKVYNSNYFRTTFGKCRNSRRPTRVTKEDMQPEIHDIIEKTASTLIQEIINKTRNQKFRDQLKLVQLKKTALKPQTAIHATQPAIHATQPQVVIDNTLQTHDEEYPDIEGYV